MLAQATENEVVAKGVGLLQNISNTIGNTISQAIQSTKDETMAIVEEKRGPTGSPPLTKTEITAEPEITITDTPASPIPEQSQQ